MTALELADIEAKLLMEGIYQVYGYDFREYSEASLRRRLNLWLGGHAGEAQKLTQLGHKAVLVAFQVIEYDLHGH